MEDAPQHADDHPDARGHRHPPEAPVEPSGVFGKREPELGAALDQAQKRQPGKRERYAEQNGVAHDRPEPGCPHRAGRCLDLNRSLHGSRAYSSGVQRPRFVDCHCVHDVDSTLVAFGRHHPNRRIRLRAPQEASSATPLPARSPRSQRTRRGRAARRTKRRADFRREIQPPLQPVRVGARAAGDAGIDLPRVETELHVLAERLRLPTGTIGGDGRIEAQRRRRVVVLTRVRADRIGMGPCAGRLTRSGDSRRRLRCPC